MTEQAEVLSAGDARARVAVLEAELAELRKRVCVPEGYVLVPVEPTIDMAAAGRDSAGGFMTFGKAEQVYRAMLAAAPAPVERCANCDDTGDVHRADGEWLGECTCSAAPVEPVKQTANVFWVLFDNTTDVKYIKKDSDAGTLAFFDNEEDAAWAKRFNPGTDYKRVEYYTAPQPAPTACTGKNCGSTDPKLHSADCFAEHEQAIAPTAAQDVAGYESVHRVRQEAQMEAIRVRQAHEADRAADKARIAAQQWLLEQCQQSLRENGETYVELDAYLRGDIDHNEVLAIKAEHEAALAQQGKEGKT